MICKISCISIVNDGSINCNTIAASVVHKAFDEKKRGCENDVPYGGSIRSWPVAEGGFAQTALPVSSDIQLDPSKYLPELSGLDMTDDQKVELLGTLWAIMRQFVEFGFQPQRLWATFGPVQ